MSNRVSKDARYQKIAFLLPFYASPSHTSTAKLLINSVPMFFHIPDIKILHNNNLSEMHKKSFKYLIFRIKNNKIIQIFYIFMCNDL